MHVAEFNCSLQVALLDVLTYRTPWTAEQNPACTETTEKSSVDEGWWHLRLLSLCLLLYTPPAPSRLKSISPRCLSLVKVITVITANISVNRTARCKGTNVGKYNSSREIWR